MNEAINFISTTLDYTYSQLIRSISPTPQILNAAIENFQLKKLRKLLEYTYQNSPFYKDFYEKSGIKKKDLHSLRFEDLPIVTKSDLTQDLEKVWTDRTLKYQTVTEFIESHKGESPLFNQKYFCITTSGSLGNKMPVIYSKDEWQKIVTIMFLRNFHIPSFRGKKIRLAAILLTGGTSAAVAMARALPKKYYDVKEISLLNNIEDIVSELNAFQPNQIVSYPGVFKTLLEYKSSGKLNITPKIVLLGGEKLSKNEQLEIKNIFNCNIMNNYGSSESMTIGARNYDEEHFTLYPQTCKVEVLNEKNQPVKPGENGSVVITNLINFTQPFLRYVIGDNVSTCLNNHGELCIKDFISRNYKPVYFTANDGKKLYFHPSIFHEIGIDIPGIKKFQIVIGNNKITAIVVGSDHGSTQLKNVLNSFVEKNGLKDVISLNLINQTDLRPESNGKIPFIKYDTT